MIALKIENKKYKAVNEWRELSLKKFIEVSKVPIPDKLKQLYETSLDKSEKAYTDTLAAINENDINKDFPAYYSTIIELLSDIPNEIIQRIDEELISSFFNQHLKHFTASLIYNTPLVLIDGVLNPYQPEQITKFKLGEDDYYFPKSPKIMGETVLMADEPIISFIEAADLDLSIKGLTEGSANLDLFMSIYSRRFNEIYDQKTVLSRADVFLACTMDLVWSLFFCIGIPIKRFTTNLESYLKSQKEKARMYHSDGGGWFMKSLRMGHRAK